MLKTTFAAGTVLAMSALTIAPAGASPTGLARFQHQRVTWTGCQEGPDDEVGRTLDQAGARCARLKVPLDYAHPGGRTISLALSRLEATDTRHRIGAMLLNGGGPGGGSIDLPPDIRTLMKDVGARYDLIGMDPRSSGRSTPVDCGWPTGTWTRSAGLDRRGFDRQVAFQRDLAARCGTQSAVLPHINTRNTARDMDVVRAALGERRLSYYGASYGTYLGAVYTQMFPGKAGRVVLDSAIDPRRYGAEQMLADAAPANERALHDWAAWAARHNGEYGLGATKRAVLATVNRIVHAAARRPLQVGTHRVDEHLVPFILISTLDDDRDEPSAELAAAVRVLKDAADGRIAEPTPFLEESLVFALTGAESPYGSSQAAVLCGDRAVRRDLDFYWRRLQKVRAHQPLTGPLLAGLNPCAFWPLQPSEQPTTIGNATPALILAATGDTRTTYENGQGLHHLLTGSRMLTLKARIHAVYPRYGNPCVNDTVNAYFRTGKLPTTDLTCSG